MRRRERGEGTASMLIVLVLVLLVCVPVAGRLRGAVMSRFVGSDNVGEYLSDAEEGEQP